MAVQHASEMCKRMSLRKMGRDGRSGVTQQDNHQSREVPGKSRTTGAQKGKRQDQEGVSKAAERIYERNANRIAAGHVSPRDRLQYVFH